MTQYVQPIGLRPVPNKQICGRTLLQLQVGKWEPLNAHVSNLMDPKDADGTVSPDIVLVDRSAECACCNALGSQVCMRFILHKKYMEE